MPKLIDLLGEKERNLADRIIKQLESLEASANRYAEELSLLADNLTKVSTMKDFHVEVKTIINKKNEIRTTFNGINDELFNNPDLMNAIKEYLTDSKSNTLLQVIQPHLILKNEIIATKERLTKQDLLRPLSSNQRHMIEQFIDEVKGLKTLADEISIKKENYREQLRSVANRAELDQLENIIEEQSAKQIKDYEARVTYPSDEAAAGALISFLEQNPHIRKIMQSFDIEEPLRDDIFHARVKLEKNAAPRP